jgi:hypothetical protein
MNRNDRNEYAPSMDDRRRDEMHGRGDDQFRGRETAPPPPPFNRADGHDRSAAPGQAPAPPESHADVPHRTMLIPGDESMRLRSRWSDIQAAFVDEPREAVRQADALVNDVTRRVTEVFASERAGLEKQWDRGDQVTTEDLRVALQRYRTFFDRLLSL